MGTKYIGEHLLPGELGHFFVLLAFVSSIVATIAYFCSAQAKDITLKNSWKNLARVAFFIQVIAVFSEFGCLYYIISNHLFEYKYAWEHSSRELPRQYLLSCFWEGQEGSFLLWTVWHCVLGSILIFTSKKWESRVMFVISFAQFCLASMLLGIYIFSYRVGSSPFVLLRNEMQGAPIFARADYLSFIKDGTGLNPLLQNYWMVIHPPILFLGFASTIVPFSFAIAGLWKKDFTGWTRPALPWSLFSAMILGTGVMMGAAWAYESLSFGGYWAWDPVENASLVPWLVMVAGIHTVLIYKHTGRALRASFVFYILSFILILYSTFLTRSGILGSTSVHAFTDLGMSGQLLIYLFIFLIPGFILFFYHYKNIPNIKKEDSTNSREFWMFLGSILLLLSALFITFTTSIPVWNKIFGTNMAPPVHPKFHYNKVEIFIAILLGLGTGAVQYLKYRKTPTRPFWIMLIWPILLTLVAGGLIALFGNIDYNENGIGFLIAIYIFLFSSVFAIAGNFTYIITALKGRMKSAGPPIAHVGFGLLLLGILISSSKKEVISLNRMHIDLNFGPKSKEKNNENTMLIKNFPTRIGSYLVTYLGDSTAPKDPKYFYKVHFVKRDTATGKALASFNLYPDAFINPKGQEGLISNPATKHFWDHDIFTYISSVVDPAKKEDTAQYHSHLVQPGDTIYLSHGYMTFDELERDPQSPDYQPQPGDVSVGAKLTVHGGVNSSETYTAEPLYYVRDDRYQHNIADTVNQASLYVAFSRILPEQKKIELLVKQTNDNDDYIVMKAYVFPFINLVWLGTLIMILGFAISIRQRILQNFSKKKIA